MKKITIAIDGYSSCGKSTLAKDIAQNLNYNYIDTGAMYRAITWFALQHNLIDPNNFINKIDLLANLDGITVIFESNKHTKQSTLMLNGVNVEAEIRSMAVSNLVSKISAIKEVREKMIALQRQFGKNKEVVLDGRDIGTNVFPDAELKLFMTADIEVRALRRKAEYEKNGQLFTLHEIKQSLLNRDHDDINRQENPLLKAKDAIVIDNSHLTKTEQLNLVLKLISELP